MNLRKANCTRCLLICGVVFLIPLLATNLPLRSFGADANGKITQESDLKAVFILNFTHFVDWPADAFTAPDAPFVIGVLGEDPFGKTLDAIVATEIVHGRKLIVRRYRSAQEISDCHVLYISPSETTRLEQAFQALRGKTTLTVGENDAFSERGGVMRFTVVQSRVRLKINVAAAKEAGLTISSQLLRQAEIANSRPAKP